MCQNTAEDKEIYKNLKKRLSYQLYFAKNAQFIHVLKP